MLIAAHIFLGFLTGALVSLRYHGDTLIIWAGIAGAVLPDIIDKPLGHLLLGGTLDYGRIYAHTLLFCAVFACFALLLTCYRVRWALPATVLAAGIAGHQVLDFMWLDPVTWYYPLLGPFLSHHYPGFFLQAVLSEITSSTEWLFLLSFILLSPLWTAWPARLLSFYGKMPKWFFPLVPFVLLATTGLTSLFTGIASAHSTGSFELPAGGEMALGLIALAGMAVALRTPLPAPAGG